MPSSRPKYFREAGGDICIVKQKGLKNHIESRKGLESYIDM